MRLGINVPLKSSESVPLDAIELSKRAKWVEDAGLEGIWIGDGISPGMTRPDPLLWLATAAGATEHVELGTCIYIVPLRHPVELAQRFMTLQTLYPGRFSIGVGPGSTKSNHDTIGIDFEKRFTILNDNMKTIRALLDGEVVGMANLNPWPEVIGGPRFILGAWHSEISLKRAIANYDGWMCSAGRTNYTTMAEAITRYRDMGGKRAMISTCGVDLRAEGGKLSDDDSFNLRCPPEQAAERLAHVAELGYDDLLLVKAGQGGIYVPDFTFEELEEIRSLIPKDDTKPY